MHRFRSFPKASVATTRTPSPTHHPPNYPRHLQPPRGLPVQPRIILHLELPKPRSRFRPTVAAVGWAVPNPRFRPPQGTLSRQPTRPRPAHSLVEPHSLQPSPRMAAQHLQRQGPSYRPHPTPPPRISPFTGTPNSREYSPVSPSSVKTSEVPTTYTTSMEIPSIP